MHIKKIKVISFDFMGVLTNGEKDHKYEQILYDQLYKKLGKKISKKDINIFFRNFIKYDHSKRSQHMSADIIKYLERYLRNKGISQYDTNELIFNMLMDIRGYYRIRNHAKNVIRFLSKSGIKMVITSDSIFPSIQRRIILEHWGILHYFDFVFTSQEFGRKTGLKIFKKIINFLGVKPQEIMHIGDNIYDDIIPANDLELRTCLFVNNNSLLTRKIKGNPDYIVRDFFDILKLIRNINKIV